MSSTLIQPFNIDTSKPFEFAGVTSAGNVTVGTATVQTITDFTFGYFQDLSPSYGAVFTTGGAAIQAIQTGDIVTLNFNTGSPITVVLTFAFYNESSGEILWTWDTTPPTGTSLTSVGIFQPANALLSINGSSTVTGQLGIGTNSPTAKLDVSGSIAVNVVAVPALDIDCSQGTFFTKTISSASEFTFSNPPADRAYGFVLELTLTSGTVTWPASVRWPGGTAPTLSTGKVQILIFITDNGGTTWYGASSINYNT